MSIKKILAASAASIVAVSAMAVVASAAKVTVPANATAWADVEIFADYDALSKLLDSGKTPEDIETITIKSDGSAIGIGYHAADAALTWVQKTDSDESAWFTDSMTLNASDISLTKDKAYLKAFGNNIEDPAEVEVTFTYKSADAAPSDSKTEDSKPEESKTDANTSTNVNTGVEGVAVVLGVAAVAAGAMIVSKKRK